VFTQRIQRIRGLFTLVAVITLAATSASAQTGEPAVPSVATPVFAALDVARVAHPDATAERTSFVRGEDARVAQPLDEQSPWPRAYVIGRGGFTFGTRTAPLLGAEVGGQIAPFLQAYGSFDWHRDISPSFLEDVGDIISDIVDADVNARLPSFTGIGGVKVIAPRGTIRPYGLGGFGYGRVNGTVEIEGEDVTELFDEFGLLDRDDITFNKALFEVGGGVSVSNGRMYMDIGYRFRKFLETGEPINMSGVYVGAGVGF
jgi:opacity protein-like surface antigen